MDETKNISNPDKEYDITRRKLRFKFWILDIVTVIISYFLAYIIRNNIGTGLDYSNNYLFLLLLMIPTFFVLIRRSNFTHIREKVNFGFILINFFSFASLAC
jgi:magnesium-transporting ATPase (P-type)